MVRKFFLVILLFFVTSDQLVCSDYSSVLDETINKIISSYGLKDDDLSRKFILEMLISKSDLRKTRENNKHLLILLGVVVSAIAVYAIVKFVNSKHEQPKVPVIEERVIDQEARRIIEGVREGAQAEIRGFRREVDLAIVRVQQANRREIGRVSEEVMGRIDNLMAHRGTVRGRRK